MIRRVFVSSFVVLLVGSYALAQTNLETNAGIQFNFSTPGAGNLALGSAFLAVADDATAAYTNPAGLMQIVDPEVHFEVRSWEYTHLFTDSGRAQGDPTGIGLDTTSGLVDGKATDRLAGLSFFSYVYPRNRWVVAFYRHQLADFEANFSTEGAFVLPTRGRSPLGLPGERDGRLASLKNQMALEIVNHGASVAHSLSTGLSLGLGLAYYEFSLSSRAERFVPELFSPADLEDPVAVSSVQTQIGDDSAWGVNAGVLWSSSNQKWSVGAAFRGGASFDFLAESRQGPGAVLEFRESSQAAEFHMPVVYGIGIAFKPASAVRVTLDYNHVQYADLLGGFMDIFDLSNLFGSINPELNQFRIDDADEVHLGFEYTVQGLGFPLFVRFGSWYDPDHSIRFEGENRSFRSVFRPREDQLHFSAGIGISRGRFQFDVAFDYSERVSVGALSTVVRF